MPLNAAELDRLDRQALYVGQLLAYAKRVGFPVADGVGVLEAVVTKGDIGYDTEDENEAC